MGFGGRAMGDEQPKYLNSPESPVFQKRRTLYGLHTAKQAMRRAQRAIIVEGYLDAIRLTLAGVEEVVAPLGTALTEEQARLLVRYASEIFLLYDSDEAGQKATFRSGMELLREKAAVRVVTLPDGEDPDSFVRAEGRAAMESQLSQAIDVFDRQVQLLERRGWFSDLRRSRRAVDKLLPTIRAASDPLTRDLYLARLADVTGLDKAALQAEAPETEPPEASSSDQGSRTGRQRRHCQSRHGTGRPPTWKGAAASRVPSGKPRPFRPVPERTSRWSARWCGRCSTSEGGRTGGRTAPAGELPECAVSGTLRRAAQRAVRRGSGADRHASLEESLRCCGISPKARRSCRRAPISRSISTNSMRASWASHRRHSRRDAPHRRSDGAGCAHARAARMELSCRLLPIRSPRTKPRR